MTVPDNIKTLTLVEDFISQDEERALISAIVANIPTGTARRRTGSRNIVQRWGSAVPYVNDVLSDVIPDHFQFLLDRLVQHNYVPQRPDSITMNQYLALQAILPHIDSKEGGSVITVLSLGTPADMVFRRAMKQFQVTLPPRSLVQMRDEIRYNWTHEILPVVAMRYSLVFRCGAECAVTK